MSEGMVSRSTKIKLNLARLKKEGSTFEVDVDPDLALKFKQGGEVSVREILKAEKIFFDAKKGLLASEAKLKSVFDSDDVLTIAENIIKHGELQLTSEQRAEEREQKRRQILTMLQANACDPKTGNPIPLQRLESAMEEAKVHVDDQKNASDQVQEIIKKLRPIIPISVEVKKVELRVTSQFAGKCYSPVKQRGKIITDRWNNDGSWSCTVEVPAGMVQELFDTLNGLTHGTLESNFVR